MNARRINSLRRAKTDGGQAQDVEHRENMSIGNPDLMGTAEIATGDPEQSWPDYGLEMVPVELNGRDTSRRLLLRNGEFIADVSKRYKILPNEEALMAANRVADELGAVPWDQFDGDWYIQMDDNVIMDQEGRRMHALYAWDDPVDLGGGEDIQFGFAVHNSIDASLGFHVGLFTFRHACANMVWMGVDDEGMAFDDRNVVQHALRKHTKGLEVDEDRLYDRVKAVLTLCDDVNDTYTAWRKQTIEPEHVSDILARARGSGQLSVKDLPAWMQDISDVLDKAEENGQLDGEDARETIVARIIEAETPGAMPIWETYNDLTASIWHNPSTNDNTKRSKNKALHRVLQPAPGVL